MDRLRKIQEYCEGKLIDDHNQIAILESKSDKLKTFTKRFDNQMSQGFKFCFFDLMQEAKNGKFVMPQRDLKNSKHTIKLNFGMGGPTSKVFHCKSHFVE